MADSPRVLVVDDEPDHRLLLVSAVREAIPEASLEEADGTGAALEAITTRPFDAVLCDFWLERAAGFDLLRAARGAGQDPAFLLVTNHGNEEVARQAFVEGVADYVTKDSAFRNPADLGRRL